MNNADRRSARRRRRIMSARPRGSHGTAGSRRGRRRRDSDAVSRACGRNEPLAARRFAAAPPSCANSIAAGNRRSTLRDVGGAHEPRVVGETTANPGRRRRSGRAGRYRVSRPSSVALIDSNATSRAVLPRRSSRSSRGASRRRTPTVDHRDVAADLRDVVVAKEVLVGRRTGLHLDKAVERLAVARLDRLAAARPQRVRDGARDLGLAGPGGPVRRLTNRDLLGASMSSNRQAISWTGTPCSRGG